LRREALLAVVVVMSIRDDVGIRGINFIPQWFDFWVTGTVFLGGFRTTPMSTEFPTKSILNNLLLNHLACHTLPDVLASTEYLCDG